MESIHVPCWIFEPLQVNRRRSIDGGGGTSDRGGIQASFFSAVETLEELLPDFIEFPTNEPRMVH